MCTQPIQSPRINDFMPQLALSETIFTKPSIYFIKPPFLGSIVTHFQILDFKRIVNKNENSDHCKANIKLLWLYRCKQIILKRTIMPRAEIIVH